MRKALLFPIFLLCVSWGFAQTYPSQSSGQSTTQSSTGNQTTVQGCLSGSNGNYTLTDTSGTTYQLSGDTSKLSDHVGHKMQITGTTTQPSASASGAPGTPPNPSGSQGTTPSSSTGANQPTLNVTSFKHISKNCGSGR